MFNCLISIDDFNEHLNDKKSLFAFEKEKGEELISMACYWKTVVLLNECVNFIQ